MDEQDFTVPDLLVESRVIRDTERVFVTLFGSVEGEPRVFLGMTHEPPATWMQVGGTKIPKPRGVVWEESLENIFQSPFTTRDQTSHVVDVHDPNNLVQLKFFHTTKIGKKGKTFFHICSVISLNPIVRLVSPDPFITSREMCWIGSVRLDLPGTLVPVWQIELKKREVPEVRKCCSDPDCKCRELVINCELPAIESLTKDDLGTPE